MAAQTQRYVEAVKPHPVQVWDTRKTTPGWRLIEKAAVKDGGGTNHRMGLYDHAMVKDNHLAANSHLASLQAAIRKLRAERPGVRVQLEADTLDQVAGFLTLEGVDMLDVYKRQALKSNGACTAALFSSTGCTSPESSAGSASASSTMRLAMGPQSLPPLLAPFLTMAKANCGFS